MNYATIQESIAAQLETANTPTVVWDVEVLPEKDADFTRPFIKGFGRLTVEYVGSSYAKPMSTDFANQEETINFHIHVRATALYGARGLHPLLELAKAKIVGFLPTDCKRLRLVQVEIPNRENNIWTARIHLECNAVQVQVDDSVVGALITHIFSVVTTTTTP